MFPERSIEESIVLWGENFNRSIFGLDEEQVKSFIGRLINEREILLESNKKYKAMAQQAEKVALDAESVANEIYRKAEESARSQAQVILERAREQANKLIEEKRIEAEIMARKGAEAIIADAFTTGQKHIKKAEEDAEARARIIIMKALVEGNELVEQKLSEAKIVAQNEMKTIEAEVLANAQRYLKEAEKDAESKAQAQAQAILFSNRTSKE